MPRLTASERSVVFGESQTPSSDADVGALDRKMHAAAQQAAGGFFGLAPGGGGMDGKLIGALESDGENTNLGGGLDDAVDPPLHSTRNQTQNQTQNQQGVPPPTGPITDAPWFYLDPSGTHQGPFKRAELLEWHDSGYFPLDLPLRPADAPPSMPFVPLAEMLECGWRYPGPRVAAQMRAEHEAQMKQRGGAGRRRRLRCAREPRLRRLRGNARRRRCGNGRRRRGSSRCRRCNGSSRCRRCNGSSRCSRRCNGSSRCSSRCRCSSRMGCTLGRRPRCPRRNRAARPSSPTSSPEAAAEQEEEEEERPEDPRAAPCPSRISNDP